MRRNDLARVVNAAACALLLLASSAHAQSEHMPPDRKSKRQPVPVELYIRGAFGLTSTRAHVTSDFESRTANSASIGQFSGRYAGFGGSLEGFFALKMERGMLGFLLMTGEFVGDARSADLSTVGLKPYDTANWWFVGPAGAIVFGDRLGWLLGGSVGRASWHVSSPTGRDDSTSVHASQHHHAGVGATIWGGPTWSLGKHWQLGAHLRVSGAVYPWTLNSPDSLSDVAVLASLAYRTRLTPLSPCAANRK